MKRKQDEKPDIRNFLFWIMIIVIIMLSFYLIYSVKKGGMRCMASPLTYGVSQLTSTNNAPIKCVCSFQGSNSYLVVTKDNLSQESYFIPNQ